MTRTQLAMQLTGRQHRDEMTKEEERLAKDNGLLVLFGASDDLLEFRGVVRDEVGAYDGTTVHLYKDKAGRVQFMEEEQHNEVEEFLDEFGVAVTFHEVKAEWCPNGDGSAPSWRITTELPHTTFNIMEDDEVYCEGIVIDVKDIA